MSSTSHSFGASGLRLLLSWAVLQVALVGASPTPVARPDTLPYPDEEPLAKRVVGQFPSFPNDYSGRVQKGVYLRTLMPLSDAEATRHNRGVSVASPWQNQAAVEQWGWTREINWAPFNTNGGDEFSDGDDFDQFETSPGFGNLMDDVFADPSHPVDPMENGLSTFLHANDFTLRDGSWGEPSQASYQNVFNPRSGAIIFDRDFSPRYQIAESGAGDVPELEQLSDLAYFQWLDACAAKRVRPNNINLIFQSHITYVPSFNLIAQALYDAGYRRVPGWSERATFSMDSRPGLAILGSTHGAAPALFLIQHKATFGRKVITEVTVWGGASGFSFRANPEVETLNLRFTVRDA
ncbi:hypothetical protein HER10_EVM0000644 [Colletotrichum scovillei]|uniref:WD domain-containing protein n=1 Tax=Colletotrichum scovillei TaxID=1209932 RepID=A0A9P7UCL8_9PEZI|nr:uncharacterized protein HER10_EVM0000644 [Colletotrichum scovillei]KAF4774530.1 hypothetical protein HER10_EVM0000644 [Colletotrichum scovillei]KAG7042607.1 WD domain-containing protein [Colletotrichum scovillei]KAG7043197.1 WD domain-containing protein [Colletotrichum scovillei]KAG7062644.1 WD domain-containing protein [Colletotrichum scovillei]